MNTVDKQRDNANYRGKSTAKRNTIVITRGTTNIATNNQITETIDIMKILDTKIVVYPSVTEERSRVRTLIKGTRAVKVVTATIKSREQVRSSTTTGNPKTTHKLTTIITINAHTTKKESSEEKDSTSTITDYQIIQFNTR